MNKKIILILSIIVVVLGFFVSYPLWKEKILSITKIHSKQPLSFSFDQTTLKPNNIDKIVLGKNEEKIILIQAENGWKLVATSTEQFDVKQEEIDGIFKEINNTKLAEVSSKNPNNYESFEINDAQGSYIGFFNGDNAVAELILGKRGPNYTSFYVREKTEPFVFLATGNLRTFARKTADEWIKDAKIATSTEENIK